MSQATDDATRVSEMLMLMCPASMHDMFAPLVNMALAQVPSETLSQLAHDLESARHENGDVDIEKLIVVGKQFGLTDEMIAGYQAAYSSDESARVEQSTRAY